MKRRRASATMIHATGFALALLAALPGCSPESKARSVFDDYEVVFEQCKGITAEFGVEPGTHYCSKVTSMALEMALEDTGLPPAKQREMIDTWRTSSPHGSYYADEARREAIPDR